MGEAMYKRQWIVAAIVAGLAGAVAWACGPMFPNQLLNDRAATLKATPQNSFAFEAMHLLEPTDQLAKDEESSGANDGEDKAPEAKSLGLTQQQADRVAALREAGDATAAFEQGQDLPVDVRAYTAGAVAYAQDDQDKAEEYFQQVLALPPEQATLRSVWAAYMVGRIHADKAKDSAQDNAAFQREREAAAKAFQQARNLAVAGASDTKALAVDSFGEEARLYLYSHGAQCSWGNLYDDANHCGDGIPAADLKRAITLYAAQAGHESSDGVQSLVAIAGNVMRDPQHMAALIDGPVAQRMLVAYALARMGERSFDSAGEGAVANKPDPRLLALVLAIEQRGIDKVAGADRLAALAYRTGRYDLASKLVDKAPGPLSDWVRAKLALQKGDLAAATAAYASAARAFPKEGDAQPALEAGNVELLTGERGVLALARGEYVEAMQHLYDAATQVGGDGNEFDEDEESTGAGYGNDAAFIAERVLTVDELKTFVDAHAPATSVPSKKDDQSYLFHRPLADNLRWLLARRLMREGRYDEAQAYFPSPDDWRFAGYEAEDKQPTNDFRAKARAYAKAKHDGEHAWTGIGKAEARYDAAVIAREDGMEILGYEQGPDYGDSEGGFQGGSGQEPKSMEQPFVTDGERQRYAASMAKPDLRFHYRYIAADEASSAADLLPPRSQAFAAVLCKATGWMLQGPPDYNDNYQGWGEPKPTGVPERIRHADALYQRYVKQGAYVAWARNFGRNCEEPDFDRARAMKRAQQMAAMKHVVRRNLPYAIGGAIVLTGLVSAWLVLRRRRRMAGNP